MPETNPNPNKRRDTSLYGHCPTCGQPATTYGFTCGHGTPAPQAEPVELPPLNNFSNEEIAKVDAEWEEVKEYWLDGSHSDLPFSIFRFFLLNQNRLEANYLAALTENRDLQSAIKDPKRVHVLILRGEIALTPEGAWHIAGGDQRVAELEQALAVAREELKHHQDEAHNLGKFSDDIGKLNDAEFKAEMEYYETCTCVVCGWARYVLKLREERDRLSKQLEALGGICPHCGARGDLPPNHVDRCYCLPAVRAAQKRIIELTADLDQARRELNEAWQKMDRLHNSLAAKAAQAVEAEMRLATIISTGMREITDEDRAWADAKIGELAAKEKE